MPADAASASEQPTVIAPDGIAIHAFDQPPAALVGVAEGRIPLGRFAVHRHLSLEQYTYVLAGRVRAITGDAQQPDSRAADLGPGDLLLTLPGESLQFVNDGSEPARVLFICAPPYPADDADTRLLDRHDPPDAAERVAMRERLLTLRAALTSIIDGRLAALGED